MALKPEVNQQDAVRRLYNKSLSLKTKTSNASILLPVHAAWGGNATSLAKRPVTQSQLPQTWAEAVQQPGRL
jgi:hypothetical protein